MSLHVALVVFVPGCVALTWWQVTRALGGNTLSWVYTVEWPIFAGYAVFMWWKLVHEDPVHEDPVHEDPVHEDPVHEDPVHEGSLNEGLKEGSRNEGPLLDEPPTDEPVPGAARAGQVPQGGAPSDGGVGAGETGGDDDELAAYNRYLAELNASGRQKRW